jgi:DNA polymerase III subunit beta
MKMTIRSEELARALYRVQGIADKKSTMPILAHVLLEATADGNLTVSATDLDVGLSGTYKAEVVTPGSVAVHAKQLYEIIKALPKDTVKLERKDNNWIELQAGSSRFKLVGMAADEFPALPSHTQVKTFTVPSADLAQMIDRTIFCVSTDDNRHNLSGVFVESPSPKMLRMVSTDGHRLAMCEKTFETDIPVKSGVIVPRKGFQELRRVLGDTTDVTEVQVGFSGNSGILKAGAVTLSTRLVEGQFPDYGQVIPKSGKRLVKIGRAAFGEALKRVSLLSQSRAWGVRLVLNEGTLELIAEDPEFGSAHEAVEVDYKGESMTIGFNARYILDVLSLVQDQGITLTLTDDLSPAVLRPLEEEGFLAVVMPMRI